MLWEHRVLTAHQITALAFPSFRSGRQRLRELYQWNVLDRFQPLISLGTAPMHYVLAPAGATVLAAENGETVKDLGYRHDRAISIAHSLRLAHTVGVNEWFTALIAATRPTTEATNQGGRSTLVAWWSEVRCTRHFGDLVKPDAYGRWKSHGDEVEFFLEYDFGTEALAKLAGKLTGYAALAEATGITTPVLIWLQTSQRETTARRALHRAWRELDQPQSVPVATAAAELLNPTAEHPSPADAIWLPLDGHTRSDLHRLRDAWPHIPPPANDSQAAPGSNAPPSLTTPAPSPMPPTQPHATPRGPNANGR